MENPIGNFVRARRQELGLSQEQLAERVGGSYGQSDISRIERGHIELPRMGTLVRLAESLEVPVGDLLIVSGWFADGPIGTRAPAGVTAQDEAFNDVLGRVEAEIDAIYALDRQAVTRTNELYQMVRDLKATLCEPAVRMSAD